MFPKRALSAGLGLLIGLGQSTLYAQDGPAPFPIVPLQTPAVLNLAPPAAAEVVVDPLANQRTADSIAQRLCQSGQLRGYRVDIRFDGGVAELTGQVGDAAQRDAVIRLVQTVAGVERVHDMLAIGVALGQGPSLDKVSGQETAPGAGEVRGMVTSNRSVEATLADNVGGQEPMSIMTGFQPGMGPAVQPPPLPPYAWPTVAPYNNFSRVATPTLYPYEAFPFIGPVYPFPKVPLGWRAVSLRWQDGHWWYGREACGHDWWRIRYY